jgi:hypothetical protein
MANLDSSWQASIVKLAQAGNSRAIAFWINRYLVPQGVCAQVLNEPSGLLVRVVCRQVPDSERLVRFICHRLCKLESEAIQQVRITAQLVGSTDILWEKSARIILPTERKQPAERKQPTAGRPSAANAASNQGAVPLYAVPSSVTQTTSGTAVVEADEHLENAQITNGQAATATLIQAHGANFLQDSGTSTHQSHRPHAGKPKRSLRLSQMPKNWNQLSEAWQESWQPNLHSQIRSWQTNSLDLTDRTVRWITNQPPITRAALLGGSAVAAFLIGCSFEIVGYYADPTAFQRSKAALTKVLQSASSHSGSVNAAAERVAVIRQPVLNPDDPTVSLVFANSATLTRLTNSQLKVKTSDSTADSTMPLVSEVEPYRLADMMITSLDSPLSLTLPSKKPKSETSQSEADSTLSESDELEAEAADSTLADETDSETGPHESAEELGVDETEASETSEASEEGELLLSDDLSEEDEHLISGNDALEEERLSLGVLDPEVEEGGAEPDNTEDYGFHPPRTLVSLMPQELLANGIDVVNVASATVMPESVAQLTHTLGLLKQNNIYSVGAGQDAIEARRPQIFDVKGQRIAYLGYSDSSPRPVRTAAAGTNVSVNEQMEADIKAIRDHVDWIVINFSWNREVRAYPEAWQIELTHAAIDHGADLVVGYHPTVTQGAEVYNGRAIVYSLGNTIDEYSEKPTGSYDTAALKVTLKEKVMELEFLPIQVKKGRAEMAKAALGSTILEYMKQASSLFDHPLKSPTSLNSQIRLSLPAAPDAKMPTEPFISYPESPAASPQPTEPQEEPQEEPQ